MRLALVSSLLPADHPGGAEAYVEAAARSLAERHDVVVLTGSRGRLEGIPTVRVPRLPHLSGDAPFVGRVVWHALDQWLPHVHAAVSRELGRVRPDVVFTHHPQGLSAAVFTAIAARGLPHVHTAHDLNLLCARMTMTRGGKFCGGRCAACRVQRLVRTNAIKLDLTTLIGVSQYICERHIRAGVVPRERAATIRLGADGPPRPRRARDGDLTVGFIGTLAPHKGVRTLLAAFADGDSRWRLIVAGSGPLQSEVAEAARRSSRIEYVGHVAGPAKDEFFERLDLVVIPSEWEEPATFVAVEAAVRGIPAVVSARGGLPETPEARLFRAGDPLELKWAVRWFVDAPLRLEDASTRLLAARDRFRWSTHIQRVEDVLEAAGAASGHARRRASAAR